MACWELHTRKITSGSNSASLRGANSIAWNISGSTAKLFSRIAELQECFYEHRQGTKNEPLCMFLGNSLGSLSPECLKPPMHSSSSDVA